MALIGDCGCSQRSCWLQSIRCLNLGQNLSLNIGDGGVRGDNVVESHAKIGCRIHRYYYNLLAGFRQYQHKLMVKEESRLWMRSMVESEIYFVHVFLEMSRVSGKKALQEWFVLSG